MTCILAGSAWSQSRPLDLKEALAAAEASNLELRAARQQRAIALAGLITARQIPNPTLTFSATRDTPHESLVWDQPFELGGKRGRRIDLAREEQKATGVELGILSRQIRRRTREAFYRVLLSRAQTKQAQDALTLATRLHDVVQQRFDLGDVAQLEVIQTEVEVARAQAEFSAAAQSERTADAQFSALLNSPLATHWDLQGRLEDIPRSPELTELNDLALRSNAEVQRTTQELQLEQSRLNLAKAQRVPNLDVQVGADFNSPPEFNVGARGQVGITLPIFYHGQGEVASSAARVEFIRLSLDAQRLNSQAQVAAGHYDYLAKRNQAEQYSQNIVPTSVRLQEMAAESYRAGKSNLLAVIDSQRRLNEVRSTYLNNLSAMQDSFAALEEVVGAPLD